VCCEYCNTEYRFRHQDLEALLAEIVYHA
jgi:redox-regulated HSP33 family molecular chaperone